MARSYRTAPSAATTTAILGDFEPDDPRLDPLWRRVSDGGQPVVHAGHAVNGLTTATEVEAVARVARRWPDARIVLAHCGLPDVDAALALLRETRSLCADLTGVGHRGRRRPRPRARTRPAGGTRDRHENALRLLAS